MKKLLIVLLTFTLLVLVSCKTAFHETEIIINPESVAEPATPVASESTSGTKKKAKEKNPSKEEPAETATPTTPPVESTPTEEGPKPIRYVSLAFGFYEYSKPIEPACGQDLKRIVMKRDWIDFGIHWFLGGIYSARSVYIYCK